MIHPNSRNQLTSVVEETDIFGNLVRPAFVDLRPRVTGQAADDRFITADASRDWTHYALESLGDARQWWVIADLSNVIDPFEELVPGRQLRAPSPQRLYFEILAPDAVKT